MLQQIFLGFIGLCSGFIIAGGLIGLLIGLSIVPRYAGITHTADHIMLYEDITLFGTELGNLFYLFQLVCRELQMFQRFQIVGQLIHRTCTYNH